MYPGHLTGLTLEADLEEEGAGAGTRTAVGAAAAEALLQKSPTRGPISPIHDIPPLLAEAALASGADPSLLPDYAPEPLFGPHELRHEVDYDEATGAIQGEGHGEEEGRPVSVIELFYDLIFAALLSKLGGILVGQLRHPTQVLFYVLVFQLIYQSWLHVTSFINRFASESASDKLFVAYVPPVVWVCKQAHPSMEHRSRRNHIHNTGGTSCRWAGWGSTWRAAWVPSPTQPATYCRPNRRRTTAARWRAGLPLGARASASGLR